MCNFETTLSNSRIDVTNEIQVFTVARDIIYHEMDNKYLIINIYNFGKFYNPYKKVHFFLEIPNCLYIYCLLSVFITNF